MIIFIFFPFYTIYIDEIYPIPSCNLSLNKDLKGFKFKKSEACKIEKFPVRWDRTPPHGSQILEIIAGEI